MLDVPRGVLLFQRRSLCDRRKNGARLRALNQDQVSGSHGPDAFASNPGVNFEAGLNAVGDWF